MRAFEIDDCRMAAEHHYNCASELTSMANDPAGWIDQFRADLRRMALWEREQALRLERSAVYVQSREDRIANQNRSEHNEDDFWTRFGSVAARNGYRRPQFGPLGRRPISLGVALYDCWPTFSLICALFWILQRTNRIKRELGRKTRRRDGPYFDNAGPERGAGPDPPHRGMAEARR
jgi:hypothetical protein